MEVMIVAYSDRFGALVSAIIGNDSNAVAGKKIGVSGTYVASIRGGVVPRESVVDQIARGYNLDSAMRSELQTLANEAKASTNPERMIIAACDAVGYDITQRAAVLTAFRTQASASDNEGPTA